MGKGGGVGEISERERSEWERVRDERDEWKERESERDEGDEGGGVHVAGEEHSSHADI